MKKIIALSFMLLMLLAAPVQADLYYDMGQKVSIYNANVDLVPDLVKDLLGNEEIYGIIEMEDESILEVKTVTSNGVVVEFTKVSIEIEAGKGDHNSDGKLTALDALSAIKMSVGKIPEDLTLDVDNSGSVTSMDARSILQSSVGLSSEVNPTILLKTDEETLRSLMMSSTPSNDFLDAYNSGAIEIEPVGFGNKVKFSIGKIVLKITDALGLV
ncbi:hypothetical protein J2755_000028 [Methanohalophilus levihalophilus]|uniref:hypothetical protein n=1 Tax=Methanohalophilus levihalophilus TaxID=1431282 RepID=UPI001AE91718|nr:hypothetical protein [Methanohalophilus levihalophilus]MBP2029108.1 hypothetical protein [Methanohalophilus levihalophilus]